MKLQDQTGVIERETEYADLMPERPGEIGAHMDGTGCVRCCRHESGARLIPDEERRQILSHTALPLKILPTAGSSILALVENSDSAASTA